MELFKKRKPVPRVVHLIRQREIQESTSRTFGRKLRSLPTFLKRLGLETELKGHDGCVNCLEWNESGTILASASDDQHVILWNPFRYEKKLTLQTGHIGNIFTVKFMPKSNDSIIVTGAGDHKIRVHDISISDTLLICNCHFNRVKRVATAPSVPFLFWSACEDGLIMQYDLREKHTCKSSDQRTVLVNLVNHVGRSVEAKCININPRRPELIAVGANDPYIRMYDRRMIKLSQRPQSPEMDLSPFGRSDPDQNIALGCVQYFVAGHLRSRDICKKYSTTYLTFNDDGDELLANMGGEQIYLFDINSQGSSRSFVVPVELGKNHEDCNGLTRDESDTTVLVTELSHKNILELSPEVEELHQKANKAFEDEQYAKAITLYNEAISLCPYSAILYGNRAGTYLKRNWSGDVYAALRDCRVALTLDPQHVKAHYRLAKCLFELKKVNEARIVMENFRKKFPKYSNNTVCESLRNDIEDAIALEEERPSSKSSDGRISDTETKWRDDAIGETERFCGHCNTITDIKEANFFGDNNQYIVAGSDDGSFFIWDRDTTNIVRVLKGDERIVNCLQPHPSISLLATSGIEPVIRLWSPLPEDGSVNVWEVENTNDAAVANSERMNTDQFDVMLLNMGYRFPSGSVVSFQNDDDDDDEDRHEFFRHQGNCRTS
ncbi:hypothetical protein QAD02_004164 [Eretmocerus hayati]|uniref:Uncharacterized protein n=1 Tax=Eretmocerus hayati TaxID=131215 RepID=A0ACC2NQ00_9HYME|nr:hypothetical protein QAD02_004164 [Eretmocerus hayati]